MEEVKLMGGSYDNPRMVRIEQLEKQVQEYREKLEDAMSITRTQLLSDESIESTGSLELLQAIQNDGGITFSQLNRDMQTLMEGMDQHSALDVLSLLKSRSCTEFTSMLKHLSLQ